MPYAAPRIALVPAARPDPRQRAAALLLAALVVVMVGYALLRGLAPDLIGKVAERVTTISFLPAPPPPRPDPPKPPPHEHHARKAAPAAPPALRAQATPIVAPKPVIVIPPPTPVVAAPVANVGAQASQGAAPVAGPGTGAGGQGNGTGAGGDGDGDGDGDGGTDLRRLSGDVRTSDVPCFKNGDCPGGTVYLRFVVGVNGRVTDCAVTRSSGSRELDRETCDAITRRLRYQPATDARGRPIPTEVNGHQRWGMSERARDEDDERDDG